MLGQKQNLIDQFVLIKKVNNFKKLFAHFSCFFDAVSYKQDFEDFIQLFQRI